MSSSSVGNQWSILHSRAKALEGRLESKIQRYSSISQKINADFLCDEENPLLDGQEEQEIACDIERDLHELYECITLMKSCPSSSSASSNSSNHQQVLIRRYLEIHFDYSSEFKNTSSTVQRKKESMELLQTKNNNSSNNSNSGNNDSSISKLLRERSSIAQSMKSINEVISQAFETRTSLGSQRSTLSGASSGLSSLTANVPSFNRLIDGIQKKKTRETMIIAFTIGILVFFIIWWLFLR